MNVLVAYASAHGSTAEVAVKIGEGLKAHGLNVVVAPIQDIQNVNSYDAFVFGSAIHAGTWLPEMSTFLRRSLERLEGKPVYFFVNCIRVMEPDGQGHVMEYYMIPEIMNLLNVRQKAAFAGKLDLKNVDWDERWTLAARYDGSAWPNNFDGDFRNWGKILAWANQVAEDIQQIEAEKTVFK